MRDRLTELEPEWIRGPRGGRVGFRFFCPECANHTISIYFALPLDDESPISMGTAGGRVVFHTGEDFDSLSIGQGLDHGEDLLIFVQEGLVVTG